MTQPKMKVEIWGDLTCVHCYTAKRKFEQALSQFKHAHQVELEWRSFELVPNLKVNPNQSMYQFLAEYNRASAEQVIAVCNQIVENGKQIGLPFNFEIARPANTLRAHRLSYLAKRYNLQGEMKEALYRAHFVEGRDIDDLPTLIQIGIEVGLKADDVTTVVQGQHYMNEVRDDIMAAQKIGLRGVPYYLFNGTLGMSGVQSDTSFLDALEKAFDGWQQEIAKASVAKDENPMCTIGDSCI